MSRSLVATRGALELVLARSTTSTLSTHQKQSRSLNEHSHDVCVSCRTLAAQVTQQLRQTFQVHWLLPGGERVSASELPPFLRALRWCAGGAGATENDEMQRFTSAGMRPFFCGRDRFFWREMSLVFCRLTFDFCFFVMTVYSYTDV
jgi:hypothetical protein